MLCQRRVLAGPAKPRRKRHLRRERGLGLFVDAPTIGVSNTPGAIVTTRMPNLASSRAIGSVIDATPPFEAE